MKAAPLIFLLALPLGLIAGEVQVGDSLDQVQTALGAPRGRAQMGQREVWSYERGEVALNARVVTRVALRSEEEQAAFETKRAATESRVREEEELRQTKLTAEGEALKASKLADRSFLSAPARQQMEFWRNFARCYPGVSVTEQLFLARAEFYTQEQAERTQAEEAQRLAELKARESDAQTFYPIQSDYAYADNRRYRTTRRLDRDYCERIRSSGRGNNATACRNEGEQSFLAQNRNPHETRDGRTRGGDKADHRFQAYSSTYDPFLVPGQNVMAWDGTKMPGGEAAGLFR